MESYCQSHSENPDYCLEIKLPYVEQLYRDNNLGIAIFSVPDLTLLKANDRYLAFLDYPYNKKENSIGKRASEVISGWTNTNLEDIWREVIKTRKTHYDEEFEYKTFQRGTTYWNVITTPICEGEEVKYLIINVREITERVMSRKLIEEQSKIIEQQKKQLGAIIETIDDIINIVDKDGNYIKLNGIIKRQFAINKLGDVDRYAKVYDLNGKELSREEYPIAKVVRGQKIKNEKVVIKKGDSEMYFDMTGIPIFDDDGNFMMGVIVSHDITEHIVQSKIIEEQNKKLNTIINSMSDGLIIIDKDKKYVRLNKAARDFYYTPDIVERFGDSLENTSYFDMDGNLIPLEKMPSFLALGGQKVQDKRIMVRRPDKTMYVSISGSPIFNEDGSVSAAVICIRYIDDQIKYEKMLKEQKDLFYKILDNLDLPIWRLSYPDLSIIELNKKAYQSLYEMGDYSDFALERIKLEAGIDKIIPNCCLDKVIKRLEKTKSTLYVKNNEIQMGNEKAYINKIIQPLLNSKGDIEELLVILVDVTSEVRQQKELERVLKIKEEFFAFISHEFKTPLTVISSAIQMIKHVYGNEIPKKPMEYIDKIYVNTLQQIRLVNNLLDITRADAGYLKIHKKNVDVVSVTKFITQSVIPFASKKGIKIKFSSSIREKVIGIDDEKYERIILNLLSNAIKFTPEGKTIYVKVSSRRGKVAVYVKDEGMGIPKDKREIIFDRFGQVGSKLTRDSEGTGIGLCLVKLLVEALGGEIKLESEEGKGSTFTVFLPGETILDDEGNLLTDSKDNRLMQTLNVELSSIYI